VTNVKLGLEVLTEAGESAWTKDHQAVLPIDKPTGLGGGEGICELRSASSSQLKALASWC
jgi:hypothetical protein